MPTPPSLALWLLAWLLARALFLFLFLSFLASFLFGIALILADESALLTGVLPVVPAVLTPLHSLSLGNNK